MKPVLSLGGARVVGERLAHANQHGPLGLQDWAPEALHIREVRCWPKQHERYGCEQNCDADSGLDRVAPPASRRRTSGFTIGMELRNIRPRNQLYASLSLVRGLLVVLGELLSYFRGGRANHR